MRELFMHLELYKAWRTSKHLIGLNEKETFIQNKTLTSSEVEEGDIMFLSHPRHWVD